KDANSCTVICNRICCCYEKEEENEIYYLKYIFCPVCTELDPEDDKLLVRNLLSNYLCCCCYDSFYLYL
ncbi:hypothetical protein MHBO_002117, partial [Bonamia ostreae]